MKKLSFLLVVLFTLTVAEARPISEQEAWQKAYQFFGNVGLKRMNKAKAKTPLTKPELTLAVSRDEFYVFNDDANGGYVIVSGDERLPNFLGYSYDGHFNADDIPCNVQAWLEGYADQIRFLQEHPEARSDSRQEVVKDYIPPLLNSHWDQRAPYNLRCPLYSATGCVATAMAQVMYYYQWPEQTLQPIPSYTTSTNKITVPEQPVTRIDWQNMLPDYPYDSYSEKQADAVATLMLLCGAAVKMDYGPGESSASVSGDAFEKYFDYYGGEGIFRNDYDNQTWCQLLYEELKDGHPVLYSGTGEKGGHQFILDGYEVMDNGEIAEPYYHVNFGWRGAGDAYYSLNNVNGFNYSQIAIVGLRPNSPGTKLPYAVLDKGKMTFYCDSGKRDRSGKAFYIRSIEDKQEITECEIDASFVDYRMTSCSSLFDGYTNLRSIKGMENLNTKNVTNMSYMFDGCSSLTNLDVSGFNTEKVIVMSAMFRGCSSLTNLNVSGFNTKNVTDMSYMFLDCSSLTNIDVSGFNTEKVIGMSAMFRGCSSLTNLDVSGFNTKNVTDMDYMFSGCSNLTNLDVSGFNTEKVNDMERMFEGCSNLTNLNVSGFNTKNVTDMDYMFSGCSNLTNLDVSGFNTEKVNEMRRMFNGCSSLTNLDVSGFNTKNVTDMSYMFLDCSSLTNLDVSGLNTKNVTNMDYMFFNCSSLTSLDMGGFKTENVTTMHRMFCECRNLTNLDLSGFNTENVTNMSEMFGNCTGLTSLDLSGLNTENVANMSGMFSGCSNLTNLDLSGFNTENVTNMDLMFYDCFGLTSLDLSGFNTKKVTNMAYMFYDCSGLTTIYASERWSTGEVTSGSNMFDGSYDGCKNLVGGKGTTFDWGHTDYIYARIDGGPEAPGYFTFKQNSGIKNLLTNEDKEKSIYSLGGQRLPTPQKGINIIGGKKVIVRSTPFLGR